MLAIGRALMSRPHLLLLDEPSMGLAPLIVEAIFNIIVQIRASGATILLVEQNAAQALEIADRGYVLENGLIVMSDRASTLLDDDRFRPGLPGRRGGLGRQPAPGRGREGSSAPGPRPEAEARTGPGGLGRPLKGRSLRCARVGTAWTPVDGAGAEIPCPFGASLSSRRDFCPFPAIFTPRAAWRAESRARPALGRQRKRPCAAHRRLSATQSANCPPAQPATTP